jgi:hypothetical protein
MNSKTISDIANIALALSLIVGLIFGIAQVRVAVRDRRERLTLEMLRQFQTREFAELLFFIAQHNFPCTRDEMQKLPANDQVMIIQFGQQMESLGMIVAEGLVNMDLVDKTLGSFVTTSWEKYKTLFLNIREVQSDPFLGEYFQWLAEKIDRRMTECPRKPFNQK